MKPTLSLLLAGLMLLSACKDITHVQTGYVSDRDDCRSKSENNVGVYSQPETYPMNDKERNTALLQLFCECMKDRDWKVAGCPKPAAVVAQTPAPAPTVVVVQSPTAQPAIIQETPAPALAAAPAKGIKKKHKVCTPPGTCPAPGSNAFGTPNQTPVGTDQELQGVLQRE